jgi:hypothetical protein
MITVITPTGDRPLAFGLLRDRWMPAQTVQPDQWIIVDDGQKPYGTKGLPEYAEYIRREPDCDVGVACKEVPKTYVKLAHHSIGKNLMVALDAVRHGKVFVMEDDDYYSPFYLAYMTGLLNGHDCVGLWGTPYFHLRLKSWRMISSRTGCALARMGWKKEFAPRVRRACPGDVSVDSRICQQNKVSLVDGRGLNLHCSIKGMPGRRGAGVGHVDKKYTRDSQCEKLRLWCGKDADVYLDLMEKGFE